MRQCSKNSIVYSPRETELEDRELIATHSSRDNNHLKQNENIRRRCRWSRGRLEVGTAKLWLELNCPRLFPRRTRVPHKSWNLSHMPITPYSLQEQAFSRDGPDECRETTSTVHCLSSLTPCTTQVAPSGPTPYTCTRTRLQPCSDIRSTPQPTTQHYPSSYTIKLTTSRGARLALSAPLPVDTPRSTRQRTRRCYVKAAGPSTSPLRELRHSSDLTATSRDPQPLRRPVWPNSRTMLHRVRKRRREAPAMRVAMAVVVLVTSGRRPALRPSRQRRQDGAGLQRVGQVRTMDPLGTR